MALEDLDGMDVPDNKGGRPKKKKEDKGREPDNRFPLLSKHEPTERVEFILDHGMIGEPEDNIVRLSEFMGVSPIYVRIWLDELDKVETDWEEFIENNPAYENDSRVPIVDGPQDDSSISMSTSWKNQDDEVTFTDDNDDSEMSSGLGALMDKNT